MDQQGAWIFVSHSHKDIEKVREIRNELERRGHNPLLFFLKCMDDDGALLPEPSPSWTGSRSSPGSLRRV